MNVSRKDLFPRCGLFLAGILVTCVIAGLFISSTAFCDEGAKKMKGTVAWPAEKMKGTVAWPAETDGWKISEKPEEYDPNTTFKYMNGAAELFLAYNMSKLTVLRYEKPGHPSITAEVFQMASPEDAYGVFSFESDDPEAGIGQGSGFGGGLLRFWKGYFFVSVYGESPGADIESATLLIGRYIASSIKDIGAPPKILSLLPNGEAPLTKNQTWFLHSHILLNQRFFIAHQNILKLANDVEAALARYGTGRDRVHLLLIRYPSQTQADLAFSSFRGAYMPDAAGLPSVKTENSKWTVTEKYPGFIIIVFDAPSEAFARKLIRAASAALQMEGK